MSEEILKALMQLFAIIAKQDVGLSTNEREYVESFLRQQLNESSVKEYLSLFDEFVGEQKASGNDNDKKPKLTSVKDSVKTLGIAKKINKTLTQKQKVVVLVRLFELVNSDKNFTPQRMAIIDTSAEVFNISKEEYNAIETFVIKEDFNDWDIPEILLITAEDVKPERAKYIKSPQLEGTILVLRIPSVELYFLRYTSSKELLLNGLPINDQKIYLIARGSVIKQPKGKPIFYTDVASQFLSDESAINVHFKVDNVHYKFPNGHIGLREVNIEEQSGKMLAVMGASGSGKTTLLNVMSGISPPTNGQVLINGNDLHENNELLKGIVGYIPQDDLLIEELTVYENLYYSTKLVYKDLSDEEISEKVDKVLYNLGLPHIKNLKVGDPLNKEISGGQRKRLNIGLELIREPAVMFVDEPTSGLSSRDSENVMELLRELTVRGKLVFVVIHQPSSELFKMFDNVTILDDGGYQIYYGNPVEAVMYFKELDNQINSDIGECPSCGNVNPETIFSIIESRIVDEYGQLTPQRKVTPAEWFEYFKNRISLNRLTQKFDKIPEAFKKPNWFNQCKIYFTRDFLSKISNKQYLVLNLLEAPLLGFLLAFVIRYIEDPTSNEYIFRNNDNIMPYIFMCTIVALFLGLIVSAEEIFKDRKILKKEAFLNLSRSSYLCSKIGILFILSAIQAFLFIMVGNYILGIKGMYVEYWLVFFSLAAFANVLGLNISSAFNSAITIYILIPFLIIPQMVLTGAMFSFDKINRAIGGGGEKVPIIAEFMPSRWAFEGLIVNQYKDNKYYRDFYPQRKLESALYYKNVYYIPELKRYVEDFQYRMTGDSEESVSKDDLELLRNEIKREHQSRFMQYHNHRFNNIDKLTLEELDYSILEELTRFLNKIHDNYRSQFNNVNQAIDERIQERTRTPEKQAEYQQLKNDYHNAYLETFTKNVMAPLPLVRIDNRLVQKRDPVYLDPQDQRLLNFRSHFLAPRKHFAGTLYDTFYFNLSILWIFTILLYIALYYQLLPKFIFFAENATPLLNQKIKPIKHKLRESLKKNKVF